MLGLAQLWIDPFEQALNSAIQFNEVTKIIGFSILSLIGLLILSRIMRKRPVQLFRRTLTYSIVLTLVVCSYLYAGYVVKIINNRTINNNTRSELLKKSVINNINATAFLVAQNLSKREYNQFARSLDLPKLNRDANNIQLNYDVTRALIFEYSINIEYSLPPNIKISEFEYKGDKKDYREYQTVKQDGEVQKVNYVKAHW